MKTNKTPNAQRALCDSGGQSGKTTKQEKEILIVRKDIKKYNMKKIIILGIVLLATMISFAQTKSSEHLAFKGVPINGTLNEFVSKMKQNGFTLLDTEDGSAIMSGDFAAYKNCTIGVVALKQKNLVSKVAVIFPPCDTWSSLASNYFSLKKMLTEKYGEPAENVEKFQSYSEPTDDNSKMSEVQLDRCKYYTLFETDNGSIELSIEHNGMTNCFVLLSYYDKINTKIVKDDAKDDL